MSRDDHSPPAHRSHAHALCHSLLQLDENEKAGVVFENINEMLPSDFEAAEGRMAQLKEIMDNNSVSFSDEEKEMRACLLTKESLELGICKKHSSLEEMLPVVFHT